MEAKAWFTNKGQLIQTVLAAVAVSIAAYKAWPNMNSGLLLSSGALLFYLLIAIVLTSIVLLLCSMTQRHRLATGTKDQQFIYRELDRLTGFESFALRYLIDSGGSLSSRQLYDRLVEWGMPVATLADQNLVMATFEEISKKTPLLKKDPSADIWSLRR